jgi:uncharacterized protein (TIGR00369 family)
MIKVGASVHELQAFLGDCPFNRFSGFQVTALDHDAGWLRMTMPLREQFRRLSGSDQIHGGPIAALIDTAGCLALSMIAGRAVPTISFSTNYLSPAAGTQLEAIARVVRAGRSIGTVDIEVVDDHEALVAIGRAVYSMSGGSANSRR